MLQDLLILALTQVEVVVFITRTRTNFFSYLITGDESSVPGESSFLKIYSTRYLLKCFIVDVTARESLQLLVLKRFSNCSEILVTQSKLTETAGKLDNRTASLTENQIISV